MKICVSYVCPVVNWPQFALPIQRFVSTYKAFPGNFPHELHVICNGGSPNSEIKNLFSNAPPIYHEHDNGGWDIGAFLKAADVDCDMMLFLGTNTHFKRAGWLRRLIDACEKFGPGLYGPSASFDISPHIRTTAFMCDPRLLRGWTEDISRQKDRHKFEVGSISITAAANRQGISCVLVTWDGFYLQNEWRKAPNIFRRGDQSNCLMFDRHHEIYESSTQKQKNRLGRMADGNKFEYYRYAIQARLERWIKLEK
jgi:hypothetical protein